jgi:uncharacterized protein YciI
MPSSHLIYHPKRQVSKAGRYSVYHDKFGGNEDPYIWNEQFLHTYCHITQLKNEEGQTNFWISGDTWPNFNALYCDCVFVIAEKHDWDDANTMRRSDPIVDSDQAYEHHYKWGDKEHGHHQLKRRGRYTLKADPKRSFQPQDGKGSLIDILPFLNSQGISTQKLRTAMNTGRGSRPFKLEGDFGKKLYEYLNRTAKVKLTGRLLADKHPNWINGVTSTSKSCC